MQKKPRARTREQIDYPAQGRISNRWHNQNTTEKLIGMMADLGRSIYPAPHLWKVVLPKDHGKIECCHRSLKKCTLLKHYCLPGDLERANGECVT